MKQAALKLRLFHPRQKLLENRQYASDLELQLRSRMEEILQQKRHQFALYVEKMKGLSPLEKLNQGYAYVEDKKGRPADCRCKRWRCDPYLCIGWNDRSAGKRNDRKNPISRIKEADMENQEQNTPGLEKLFARLEEVTADMEKSDITLEESFALYNEGMQLLKQCNETIDAVEKKVQVLDENGEVHEF